MEYTGYVIDQRIPLTTAEDLHAFLSTGVRENFILDFKRDFPKNLEKTLGAFANTYGGTILIGVDETPTGAAVLPVHGLDLRKGLRERVLQIALDNIYPPLVPDVHVIPIKSSATIADADRAVIVVRVHESDDASYAVEDRTAVYLRVDNISDRFERKATIGEIEWLINKREKSVAEKARILRHVQIHAREYRERRSRRNTGQKPPEKGQIVFYTVPRYPRDQLAEPRRLREIAHSARVQIAAVPSISEGATTGAGTGALLGGGLEWLAGIGALAIPGLGPFIAAGPIMAALAGAGVGGAVGGLTGALVGMGIPEYEAKRYEGRVKDGGILLSVHSDSSDETKRAKEILQQTGAQDISSTGEASGDKKAAPRRQIA